MAENFVGEENLEISSNQQKGRVDSPIHCLNLATSNIILVGGTTYLSGHLLKLHLSNVFGSDEFNHNKRCMPPLL